MSGGQMPCSPPMGVNSQMPLGPRPGMQVGPGMGGQVPPMGGPAPPMGGPVMCPGGYSAPMPGVPGGYIGQMSASSNQMMMGSGSATSGTGGIAPMESQTGVSQNVGSHQSIGGPNIPSSQPPVGPGMPGPVGASGGFMPSGGPNMAGQMQQPNGSSVMMPSVSGPMTSVGGAVSGMSSSVPVGSPTRSSQASVASSTSQSAVVSTVSSQAPPGGPYMTSGSTVASQVPPSSSTGMPVPACVSMLTSGSNVPNQMGTYSGMPQHHMQPPGSGVMMQPVPGEMNGGQGMPSSSGSVGNGPGMGQGAVGPVGQMTGIPAQGSSGSLPGPGGMNMASAPTMGGPNSQMQNNMAPGGILSSGSVVGQPGVAAMPAGRPGNQFMGGPTSGVQMGSGLPSSVAIAGQVAGQHMVGTAPRMSNPSSIGPSPQMSGTQQPMQYGYGSSMAAGQPLHQSSAMNNMYGWNAPSSGGGMPPPQNMISQGTSFFALTHLLKRRPGKRLYVRTVKHVS